MNRDEIINEAIPDADEINLGFAAPFSGMKEMYALQKGLEIGTLAGYDAAMQGLVEALRKIINCDGPSPEAIMDQIDDLAETALAGYYRAREASK